MSIIAKAIKTVLPGGEPHGIRIAEITTRIVQPEAFTQVLLPQAPER